MGNIKKERRISRSRHVEIFLDSLNSLNLFNVHITLDNITAFNISRLKLETLPECLKLRNVTELNLSHNNLRAIPDCLFTDGFPKVEILDISYNKVRDFDNVPYCINNLKVLRLNYNNFRTLPQWVLSFKSTNLKSLNFSRNKISRHCFKNNSINLLKLTELELDSCCLSDGAFSGIKQIPNLQFLNISNNTNYNYKFFNKFNLINELFDKPVWANLKVLKLNLLEIYLFPKDITNIVSLEALYMQKNEISWFSKGLGNLLNLEILDISENHLVFVPSEISNLIKLKVLILSNNFIEDLPDLPSSITVLDLYDNHLISFNNIPFNSVDFIDIDYNYVDLEDDLCFDFDVYKKKRQRLREVYKAQNRVQHKKMKLVVDKIDENLETSSESESDTSSRCLELDETITNNLNIQDYDNWDQDSGQLDQEIVGSDEDISAEEMLFVDAD